ncbi:type I secretion protein [uncultured Nitratireductor sp.]|uniref:type I secretion protein n=1 Tax=uncultured Nitratireductor sp. TaxID=520953 RepID=UPI0025E799C5|nr:type I secretion protein [uncultured Nitratireductor sp.]
MHMDQTTEAIAHFIGLFSQAVEEVRLRLDYEDFRALPQEPLEQNELLNVQINIVSPYSLEGFKPQVEYTPPPIDRFDAQVSVTVSHDPIPLNYDGGGAQEMASSGKASAIAPGTGQVFAEYQPLGSLALYLKQEARLEDNDYLSIGDHGLVLDSIVDTDAALAALIQAASTLQPFADLHEPGSAAEIGDFIMHVPLIADAFVETLEESEAVFVSRDENVEGKFVNGEEVEELPTLDAYLPNEIEDSEESDGTGTDFSTQATMNIEAGANLLVNEAILINDWYGTPVLAIAGDYIHLNAISQLNVWSDNDTTSDTLSGWKSLTQAPTQAFNVATIQTIDNRPPPGIESAESVPVFPAYWQVSRIDGDLMLANWIKQVSFVEDNDITVMSASGGGTEIVLGDNTVINATSLAALGNYYDLIIVGGSVYHANIISQTNILLDNDFVGAVGNFQTTGEASLSTGGNLLWNEASITQYGTMSFDTMPPSYLEALDKLAEGSGPAPQSLLSGSDFAGLTNIKVLYISGDVVDLQYVSQINVLGDADQVALAKSQTSADTDADWSISTGSNALINQAAIADGGVNSTTYTGGAVYSDELLIQAELISNDTDLYTQGADALVSEAVAFLSDDLLAPSESDGGQNSQDAPMPDGGTADVMQTMLG